MKKILILIIVTSMVLGFVGCAGDVAPADDESGVQEVGEIILTGSSTLAPVVTQLIAEFMETNVTWDKVDASFPVEEISIVINGGGSGAGISSAIEKTANFGMASKNVSEEEQAKFDGYNQYKLGTDALTIAVNPSNKIYEFQDGFTSEELQKIFSGEYLYWDDVNAELPHAEIVVVTRDIGGGAHEVFQKKIMGDIEVSLNVIQAPSMGALVAKIIENEKAIGYASFGVVNQNESKIIPMPVDGVDPTQENIISGDYKISRPLLVLKNGEMNPQEKALLDFLTSDRGMQVVSELGFVPEN
jgi:phosphate transport system substrate-binding protein